MSKPARRWRYPIVVRGGGGLSERRKRAKLLLLLLVAAVAAVVLVQQPHARVDAHRHLVSRSFLCARRHRARKESSESLGLNKAHKFQKLSHRRGGS